MSVDIEPSELGFRRMSYLDTAGPSGRGSNQERGGGLIGLTMTTTTRALYCGSRADSQDTESKQIACCLQGMPQSRISFSLVWLSYADSLYLGQNDST